MHTKQHWGCAKSAAPFANVHPNKTVPTLLFLKRVVNCTIKNSQCASFTRCALNRYCHLTIKSLFYTLYLKKVKTYCKFQHLPFGCLFLKRILTIYGKHRISRYQGT